MSTMNSNNYFQVSGWMVNELHLKGNELLIYAIIYGFSQAEEQVFSGSIKYLEDWTGAARRSVQYSLKSLVDKGLVIKEESKEAGVLPPTYYTAPLNFARGAKIATEGVQKTTEGGAKNNMGGCKKQHDTRAKSAPNNNILNNNINNNINKTRTREAEIEIEFDEIYSLYPKKKGRDGAYKAYLKARSEGVTFEEVKAGILAFNKEIASKKTESVFIPYASTWFNQKRWDDEYETSQNKDSPSKYANDENPLFEDED